MKPPLKWAGGKRWQVPHVLPLWRGHAHKRLVEPFCGGLAMALGLEPHEALLSDANPHLINFYRWLQRGLTIDLRMENDAALFYEHRLRFNQWDDQVRTAEWLSRHPGPVVLSNQATDRIVSLYSRLGFTLVFLTGPRRINCTGDRTPAREVLALRNIE